jgi:hypothetical protein
VIALERSRISITCGEACKTLALQYFSDSRRLYLICLVEHRKPIPRNEYDRTTGSAFTVRARILYFVARFSWELHEFEDAIFGSCGEEYAPFGRVEAECLRCDVGGAKLAHAQYACICAVIEIVLTDVFVSDIVEGVIVHSECRSFALEFEDDQAIIVT